MKHSTNIWRAQLQLHQTPEMSTKNLLFAKNTKPTTHWNSHIGTHHPLTIFILQADCSYSHLMLISPIINNTTDQPNESINPCRFCIFQPFQLTNHPIYTSNTNPHSLSYKWQPSQYQSHTPQNRRNKELHQKLNMITLPHPMSLLFHKHINWPSWKFWCITAVSDCTKGTRNYQE